MNMLRERVLITVKTYPNPSHKYEETVCTAGLALGLNQFVRLYPVRFRDLPYDQWFKKWDIVEADIQLRTADARGDTYTPLGETLPVVGHIGTGPGRPPDWAERNEIILPHVSTVEELVARSEERKGSLGLVRAEACAELKVEADEPDWTPEQAAILDQQHLFGGRRRRLEKIPHKFYYQFKCHSGCDGHKFMVLDWEIYELYRSQAKKKGSAAAVEDVLQRYNGALSPLTHDIHFFVGTSIKYQAQFSIVGVYYPPRRPDGVKEA